MKNYVIYINKYLVSKVMSEIDSRKISGLLFVATILISTGIGLLFERPDVGGCIGVGLGFIIMALVRYGVIKFKTEYSISIRGITGFSLLTLVGILLITLGLSILFNIEQILKYVSVLVCLITGVLFLILGFKILKK